MKDVTISYKKYFGRGGSVYNTRVNMTKEVFNNFFEYLNSELNAINEKYSKALSIPYDVSAKKNYIEADIEEYKSSQNKNLMYLRLSSSKILNKYLNDNNLNISNRNLLGNTFVTIK